MRRKVTIKEVAREAGVSATTVSYVLNQNERQTISEETRARVLAAVEKLHYIPNYAARIMKNDESCCIGLVMNRSFRTVRFSKIAAGIVEVLEELGYRVMLCSGKQRSGQYSGYLEDYFRYHMDGLIFICSNNEGPSDHDRKVIETNQIPIVVFDSLNPDVPYATVDFDYYGCAAAVTRAMIQPGQRRMAYFRPGYDNRQESIRETAFFDVLRDYPSIAPVVIRDIYSLDQNYELERERETERKPELRYETHFRQLLAAQMKEFDSGDGLITSWAVLLPSVLDAMTQTGFLVRLGTMAQAQDAGWGKHRVVHGVYQNYRVGMECARLLLRLLQAGGCRNLSESEIHIILPVEAEIIGG